MLEFSLQVFQPDDAQNAWRLAKMWANLADASMQLSVTHLGMHNLDLFSNLNGCFLQNQSILKIFSKS